MTSDNNPSKTFCILPWIHLNLWPSGDVHACCLGDWENPIGNVKDNTLVELANSDAMKNMRKQMLSGEAPAQCDRCFDRERMNIVSFRQSKNNIFKHRITEAIANTNDDFSLREVNFRYWDFRFSNLCNMKCRMCGSGFSSLWYDDEIAMGNKAHVSKRVVNANEYSKQDLLEFVDQHIHEVEFIYFAGGEPLIMDEHYYILEKLIELGRTDVILRYNTNGLKLKFKNHDLLDLWSNFNIVNVSFSADSFGSRAEYIRHGTRWNIIKKNIELLAKIKNISLNIEVTTGLFNIYTLPEFFDELLKLGVTVDQIHTHNVLQTPLYYHSAILNDADKANIVAKFNAYVENFSGSDRDRNNLKEKFKSIVTNMNKNIENLNYWRESFLEKTSMLDKIRNEEFLTTFPELESFYNSVKNNV